MLKCFIFRINQIIADISLLHFLSWKSVFSEIKISITKKQWDVVKDYTRLSAGKTLLKLNKVKFNESLLDGLIFKKNEIFKHLLEYGLTPKSIYLGVPTLLDEIKKRGFLLACSSSSANAVTQLKKMKLYSKFDYVVDHKAKQVVMLSQRENSELVNPAGLVLKELGLNGGECIGFEHDIVGIQQYKALDIYAVLVGSNNDKNRKQADFNVDFSGEMPLDEIIFNYYKKHAEDKENGD